MSVPQIKPYLLFLLKFFEDFKGEENKIECVIKDLCLLKY